MLIGHGHFDLSLNSESTEALLHEIGSFEGSLNNSVSAAYYVFRQSALKHEDAHSYEPILEKQIEQLSVKLNNLNMVVRYINDELALLKTLLCLGDIILRDRAIIFPQMYKHYCLLSLLSVPPPQ